MEEIHNEERGERRNSNRSYKRKKQSIVHYLIPTVLFISMLVFGGLFLRDFLEYKAANDEYAQLEEHIVVEEEPKEDNKGDATQESEAAKEQVDFSHPKFQILTVIFPP